MKKLFAILLISILLTLTYSCVTKENCREKYPCDIGINTEKVVTIKEIVRDTIVFTAPDKGVAMALLACDSLGKVYIRQIIDLKAVGKSTKPDIQIHDNIIKVVVPVDSQAIYITLRNRETTTESKTEIKPAPEIKNYLTGWQWFQLWVGRFALMVIILYLLYLLTQKNITTWKRK